MGSSACWPARRYSYRAGGFLGEPNENLPQTVRFVARGSSRYSAADMKHEVLELHPQRSGDVAAVLTQAFAEDELFRQLFGWKPSGIAPYFAWVCGLHSDRGMPFLGATANHQLVGVLICRPPQLPGQARLRTRLRGLTVPYRVGHEGWRRVQRYSKAVRELRPDSPLHSVTHIGVLRQHRRTGLRGALLGAAISQAEQDPTSRGIALETFNPGFASGLGSEGWNVKSVATYGGIEAYSAFLAKSHEGPASTELRLAPAGPPRGPQVK